MIKYLALGTVVKPEGHNDAYIISQTDAGEAKLISLRSGNRWKEEGIKTAHVNLKVDRDVIFGSKTELDFTSGVPVREIEKAFYDKQLKIYEDAVDYITKTKYIVGVDLAREIKTETPTLVPKVTISENELLREIVFSVTVASENKNMTQLSLSKKVTENMTKMLKEKGIGIK